MTQLTKRKLISGALRGSSALVAASVPIWLIAQKFPLWATEQTAAVSLTGGGVAAVIIAVLIFWKKILLAIKPLWDKLKNLRGVVIGTVIVAGSILGICYLVRQVYPILPDIETICMGAIVSGLAGVGIDVAATLVAPKEDKEAKSEEAAKEA
jgi:hypothetical protein